MTWRCVSAGRTPRRRWESLLLPLSLQLADGGVEDQVAVGLCEMKLAVCFKFALARLGGGTPGLCFGPVWFFFVCVLGFF